MNWKYFPVLIIYLYITTPLVNNITKYTRDELSPFLLRILTFFLACRVIEITLHFVTSSLRHQVPFICATKTKSPVESKLYTLLQYESNVFSDERFVAGSNRPKHRPKCRDNVAKPKSTITLILLFSRSHLFSVLINFHPWTQSVHCG